MWARLHAIPFEYWTENLIKNMAKTIGRPVKVDPISLNKKFCLYARVQIAVDLQFALPPKVLIEREDMNFELHVTYENLPAFCTHCGTIGHFVGTCRLLKKVQNETEKASSALENKPKFTAKTTQQFVPKNKTTSTTAHPLGHNVVSKATVPNNSAASPVTAAAILPTACLPTAAVHVSLPYKNPLPAATNNAAVNQQNTAINPPNNGSQVVVVDSSPASNSVSSAKNNVFSANSTPSFVPNSVESHSLTDSNAEKSVTLQQSKSTNCSSSTFYHSSPTQSLHRSLSSGSQQVPYNYTKSRHYNKYSPLSEHLFDDDDDGESWEHSSEENFAINPEDTQALIGYYSPAGSDQFIAVPRPPTLNVGEALNWGNMVEEEPFQS